MKNEKVIVVLQDLIETCRDGQNGYRDAAEHVKDPEVRDIFIEQSDERASFVAELQNELQSLGEAEPEDEGSAGGAIQRAWMDLKANLGRGDSAILNSVEQGEDNAKDAYQKALREPLPENILTIIRRQAQSVFAAHDQVKLLRDRRKAA